MEVQDLTIEDFKGGITDYYIGGKLDKFRVGNNFVIQKHQNIGKLFTRPGSQIWDSTNTQIPAGAQRIGYLKFFEDTLLVQSAKKVYYVNVTWQTLQGPSGNDVFPTGTTTASIISSAFWHHHLFLTTDGYIKPLKIFKNNSGALQVRTAGMPFLASTPTVTNVNNTGKNYLYRFTYEYTYNASGLTYLNIGPTTEATAFNVDDPSVTMNVISGIPVLTNGSADNYDTANVVVGIYRTLDSGQTFFKVATVTNGTTTYNDVTSDVALQDNELLYTEGGVIENDPPPLAKVVHIKEQFGYYANTAEIDGFHTNRVYQSIPDSIDSVPGTFFIDLDDEIVGLSSVNDITVVLGKKFTYRLDGNFDELGRGSIVSMKIGDTAGCISSQSIVQTVDGIYWAGPDGFYYSDAFKVLKINKDWNQTYATVADGTSQPLKPKRIQGKYDSLNRRIYWTCLKDPGSTDCDAWFTLDLNWGISDDMPFTSSSNGDSFAPTAIEFVNNKLIRADRRGYLFKHDDPFFTDPKIDITKAVSQWSQVTIFYDYQSCAYNFGTDLVRKFVMRASIACANETNLSLQMVSNNDDSRQITNLAPIRFKGNMVWGDPDVVWGDPNIIWNRLGLITDFRRMPKANLRCLYKQLYLQPAFIAITNSDSLGVVTVSNSAKTATLGGSSTFPTLSLDYFIAFEIDNYTNTYLITNVTSNVVTFLDPANTSPNGSQQWVIRGYPKGEILNLISYTLNWSPGGRTQDHYQRSDSGEVGS